MRRSSPGPRAALPEGSLLGTRWRFLNERGGLPGAGNAPTAAEAAAAPGGRAHCRGADEAAGAELVALRARIGRRRRRVEERLAAAASSGDDGVRELLLGAGGGGPKTRWAPAPLVGGPHAQKARSEAETAAHRRGRTSPGRAQLHQQQAPPGAGGGSGGRARRRQLQPLSSPVASSRRARDGGTADAQARAAIVAARNSYGAWYIAPGKWASASAAARAAAGGVGEGGAEGSRVALLGSDAALQAMGVLGSEPLSPYVRARDCGVL